MSETDNEHKGNDVESDNNKVFDNVVALVEGETLAVKKDTGKPVFSEVTRPAADAIGEVRLWAETHKYPKDNWKLGMPHSRVLKALFRHIHAWKQGEDLDPESGLSHIGHMLCCCEQLAWDQYYNIPKGVDDRATMPSFDGNGNYPYSMGFSATVGLPKTAKAQESNLDDMIPRPKKMSRSSWEMPGNLIVGDVRLREIAASRLRQYGIAYRNILDVDCRRSCASIDMSQYDLGRIYINVQNPLLDVIIHYKYYTPKDWLQNGGGLYMLLFWRVNEKSGLLEGDSDIVAEFNRVLLYYLPRKLLLQQYRVVFINSWGRFLEEDMDTYDPASPFKLNKFLSLVVIDGKEFVMRINGRKLSFLPKELWTESQGDLSKFLPCASIKI